LNAIRKSRAAKKYLCALGRGRRDHALPGDGRRRKDRRLHSSRQYFLQQRTRHTHWRIRRSEPGTRVQQGGSETRGGHGNKLRDVDGYRALANERKRIVGRTIEKQMSGDQARDTDTTDAPHLLRRFGLLEATALNMTNMIGIGPFITIPLLLTTLGGPQAMVGWLVALVITISDGMIWSELGASMPGSGGSYVYLREGFGRETFGRLMGFLF